jgi:hypothetical protein
MGGCEQRLGGRTARRRFLLEGEIVSEGWSPSIKRGFRSGAWICRPGTSHGPRRAKGDAVLQRRSLRGRAPGTSCLKPSAKPGPEEWQELCRSLLIRLSQRSNECERLRVRVEELAERLEAVEAERDQANAIAEDLYEFFRNRVRETVDRRERSGRRSVH